MHAPAKYVEKGLSWLANGLWYAIQPLYRISPNPSITPAWSDKPLLKSQREVPSAARRAAGHDLSVPACTREARQAIVDSKATPDLFTRHHAGEIPAQIIERDGKVWMVKDCPTHGHYEDVLSTDPAFFRKTEEQFPGSGHPRPRGRRPARSRHELAPVRPRRRADRRPDEPLQHDVRPVLHGRQPGGVRPRARVGGNQGHPGPGGGEEAAPPDVGAVLGRRAHDLEALPEGRRVLHGARVPKRPGGHQRHRVRQGSRSSATRRARPGLRFVYLQFDGIGNAANQHRHVPNLFDVKLRAIENLHAAGVDIVPVTTIINGINNEQVGPHRRVRPRQPEEDLVPLVPARVVHRPRRGDLGRAAGRAALHAGRPRPRHQAADRHRRAAARLVPDLDDDDVRGLGRPDPRADLRLGPAQLRVPSRLRRGHGRHDRQEHEGARPVSARSSTAGSS